MLVAGMAFAGINFGCNAMDDGAADKKDAAPAATVKKAVTPGGEIICVVAVWDAEVASCDDKAAPCKTAKCWQDKDGNVMCVKPLKECPMKGKDCPCAEHYKTKKSDSAMCLQTDSAAVSDGQKTNWCAKMVKVCPKKGSSECPAKEHVTMPNSQKGCSPADVKTTAQPAQTTAKTEPVVMGEEIMDDGVFLITTD